MRKPFSVAFFIAAIGLGSHSSTTQAVDLKMIAAGPLTAVVKELAPRFERDRGHNLFTLSAAIPVVKREIDAGEPFDLVISVTSDIDDWINQGKIIAATRAAVAHSGLGVAIRVGASKPDITSVEAFKKALLNARSIAHGAESASAAYFKDLLDRLGIADEITPKLKPGAGPGAVLKTLVSGEAEIGISTVPTILSTPGVELVGPLPAELQTYLTFSAGVSTRSKQPEAAKALITFLTSPAAVEVIKAKGLEPGTPK